MSHYTLLVVLPPGTADVDAAVAERLAPYEEDAEDRRFLEFQDTEDEWRADFESGVVEMVELADGTRLLPWDDRLRVPGTFGLGSDTHRDPPGSKRIEVPQRERYTSLDAFAADWHLEKARDPERKRFGHWRNPNGKWDWFQIGGRWPEQLLVDYMEKGVDVAKVEELDWVRIDRETTERADAFWKAFEDLRRTGREPGDDPFSGPRSTALRIGLCTIAEDAKSGGFKWERADRYDVYDKAITREGFLSKWSSFFCPIRTRALLDDAGWHEPGRMGWFAATPDDTPETVLAFARGFVGRIRELPPESILVVVDCHT